MLRTSHLSVFSRMVILLLHDHMHIFIHLNNNSKMGRVAQCASNNSQKDKPTPDAVAESVERRLPVR